MPLHIAARLHAFVFGLFRPNDKTETLELYSRVVAMFDRHELRSLDARLELINEIAADVLAEFDTVPALNRER